MNLLEPMVLIALFFSIAGLFAALAAAVVTVGKLEATWRYSESTSRGSNSKGSRCASVYGRMKRGRDCPTRGRRMR